MALLLLSPSAAAARTVAVLEFRAGARGAQGVAAGLAEQLTRLTSNQVVSPADARRRIGPSLDARVARCAGDPSCLARIGGDLDCDEVLMVGVSQLGDVILAVQRIDVSRGKVLSRLADSIRPGRGRLSTDKLAGYLRRLLPPEQFNRFGQVKVITDRTGDQVFVDSKLQGTTPLLPLRVGAPGRIELRVTRPGHQDFVARLDVVPDASVEVNATLGRIAGETRWYQRWWVWAIVGGVVVAGTAAAVAAAMSDAPDQVPAVVRLPPLSSRAGALVRW